MTNFRMNTVGKQIIVNAGSYATGDVLVASRIESHGISGGALLKYANLISRQNNSFAINLAILVSDKVSASDFTPNDAFEYPYSNRFTPLPIVSFGTSDYANATVFQSMEFPTYNSPLICVLIAGASLSYSSDDNIRLSLSFWS